MNVIDITNVSKIFKVKIKHGFWRDMFRPEYRHVSAVDHISFSVKKGESVAFLGPNGAGKTTTIKMLTGLIYPTTGSLSVLGHNPNERQPDYLRKIGLVMGNKAGLNWDLTSRQSFDLFKQIYRVPEETFKTKLDELTQLLEVNQYLDVQVRKLSLGERMKMELIGSLLHSPEILFLDEPTIGLDIISKQKIRDFLRHIQKESNITILLTSHDMDDVEKVCDRVIVINKGKKAYDDKLTVLMQKYNQHRFVKFIFANSVDLVSLPFGELVEADNHSALFKVAPKLLPDLIAKAAEKYQLDDIDIIPVPLESIIADIFKTKK
jgi:ABC-2 type transport system ATP-binding protein